MSLDKSKQQPYTLKNDESKDIWSFENYLKELQRNESFGVKEVVRIPQQEVQKNFLTGQEETIQFSLIVLSSGAVVKGTCTITPKGDSPSRGDGHSATFKLDLSNIHTEKEAREAFENFEELLTAYDLKNHPAGKPLKYYTAGGGEWNALGNQIKIEKLKEHEQQFMERGIDVYVNDMKIIDASRLRNAPERERTPKPWDVPRGAPDLKNIKK